MLKIDYITIRRKKLQKNKANNDIIINYKSFGLFEINTVLILTLPLCKNLYKLIIYIIK